MFLMFAGCLFLVGCTPVWKNKGCKDSAATNYDKKARKSDNSVCLYSVSGLWKVVSYINGSTEIMDSYSSLTMDLKPDGSSVTRSVDKYTSSGTGTPSAEFLRLLNRTVYGYWTLTDSTLELTNSSGDKTIWTISFQGSQNMTISSDDVAGQPATIVFTR